MIVLHHIRDGYPILSLTEVMFSATHQLHCERKKLKVENIVDLPADIPFPYPIIDDEKRELAHQFQMLDKDEIGKAGLPLTCRAVFIVDSKKKLRAKILYPATTGRNFE